MARAASGHAYFVRVSALRVSVLGGGWVGEEALAISIYCSLVSENDLSGALLLAVNHSGDSDSTGAITGNILGALHGIGAIPVKFDAPSTATNICASRASPVAASTTGTVLPQ
ncbi:MAG: ADP-ribosylglycohydrolase family protein [Acidobacteria bacterium]|nr:ADP-ribosylglycohydrolase family protein [Acidobacteriota bacterium]